MRNSGYNNSGDGKIDWRIKAFAIPALIILGFLLGYAVLSPWWNSRNGNNGEIARNQIPPSPRPGSAAQKKNIPKVDVQITENPTTPAAQPTDDQSGVKKDANGLTVTMEPNSGAGQQGAENPSAGNAQTQPEQQSAAPVEKPVKSPSADESSVSEKSRVSVSTPTGKGPYRVQAGTFAVQTSADNLVADLRAHGYRAETTTTQVEDRVLYRVQVGEYKSRASADRVAAKLKADGYAPTVVPVR
jgi:cell division protein FtsN